MSVLKNNRGTSELEFYHTAIKLRKEITQNLLRDFGVKNRDAVRSKNFPDDELRVKIVQEYPKMELFFNKYTRMQEEIRTRDVVSEYQSKPPPMFRPAAHLPMSLAVKPTAG